MEYQQIKVLPQSKKFSKRNSINTSSSPLPGKPLVIRDYTYKTPVSGT